VSSVRRFCVFAPILALIFSLSANVMFVSVASADDGDWRNGERARLQTLDKITARIATIDVPIGVTTQFGTLELYVHACKFRPPDQPPDHAALIEIRSVDYDGKVTEMPIFMGWMFASSPAISGLEHAVYDITVLSCNN
jgi:hypothetical protein